MSKPDIEILDDAKGYPYSSHISVEGIELQFGDLLLMFESTETQTVNFFERVYGFTWPGVIIHVIDGPVPAEFREFERIAEGLESGEIAIASEREQASFFVDDDTVRTLSLYRYQYRNGWQPILIDERRGPLEDVPSVQSVILCENSNKVIEELFANSPPTNDQEIEHIRNFLQSAGYQSDSIPDADELSVARLDE